jgi:hypothetical protein
MKENVFPTRRSVVPTLSLNKSTIYLNTNFTNTFYKSIKDKNIYCSYQKKGKKFYLLVSKKKRDGFTGFYKPNLCNARQTVLIHTFTELKSSDVPRYECKPVKTDLKGIDVYELKPYAFDSIKSLEFFNFKIIK